MSDTIRVAVPVESGEGLEAVRSAHFGHAGAFALVDVADGAATGVTMLPNPPHSHGGCGMTVNLLADNGVTAVSAVGMGRGPLSGLLSAGIEVHHDPESTTVGEAVTALLEGRTHAFGGDHVCQGH